MQLSFMKVFLLLILGTLAFEVPAKIVVLQHHTRHAVFQSVVDYLSRTENCFDGDREYICNQVLEVEDVDCKKTESECFQEFKNQVDIIYSPSSDWNLGDFTEVNANVFQSSLSYRVPVVKSKDAKEFVASFMAKKIKEKSLVFNSKWTDYKILESEGYRLVPTNSYDEIIEQLKTNKAFYTLRGIEEVMSEAEFLRKKEFTVFPHLLVYYPYRVKIYVNNRRVKNGIVLWHRLKYLEKFSPDFFKGVVENNISLDSKKPCSVFVGSLSQLVKIDKCEFEKVKESVRKVIGKV